MSRRGRPPHPDILTPREWEVLACIREELSNEEIAGRLGISLDGVKYHVTEILSKLGLENRHDAARWKPEEPRRWWAALPLLFWRRLGGWLSPALAGGLAVAVAAGIGVLVWALVAARSGNGTTATTIEHPLAAYTVVGIGSDPLAPLYIKAIDPFTGADVPGRDPIELGHDGVEALSPDGSTIALGWAAADTGGAGPQRLSLLDVKTWTKRDTGFLDGIARLFWSPDGKTIYAQTYQCDFASYICNFAKARLVTIDASTGDVGGSISLPFYADQSFLSPDGRTLYLFGAEFVDPQVVPSPPAPQLASIDIATGHIIAERSFPEILDGSRLEHDPSGDHYAQYAPGVVMRPDGQEMYIAYPDSDQIANVQLPGMNVVGRAQIDKPQASLIGRFLSMLAGTAEAKGGPTTRASLHISADGSSLYYSRYIEEPPQNSDGTYPSTAVGPWLLGTDPGLHGVKQLDPQNIDAQLFLSDVSDKYIFALRGLNVVVLDPKDLHEISGGVVGAAVFDLLVGPALPANR